MSDGPHVLVVSEDAILAARLSKELDDAGARVSVETADLDLSVWKLAPPDAVIFDQGAVALDVVRTFRDWISPRPLLLVVHEPGAVIGDNGLFDHAFSRPLDVRDLSNVVERRFSLARA